MEERYNVMANRVTLKQQSFLTAAGSSIKTTDVCPYPRHAKGLACIQVGIRIFKAFQDTQMCNPI
jgi:hypothetical protein